MDALITTIILSEKQQSSEEKEGSQAIDNFEIFENFGGSCVMDTLAFSMLNGEKTRTTSHHTPTL